MNSPRTGGILKGKKHSQCDHNGCGIKTVAGSVHKEAEGGEFLLSAKPLKSKKVITVTGTKRQIAEKINGAAGIVEGKQTLHVDPGQYVINARAMTDPETFKVTGTPLQIASAINSDKGYGIVFAPGGTIFYYPYDRYTYQNKNQSTKNIMSTRKKSTLSRADRAFIKKTKAFKFFVVNTKTKEVETGWQFKGDAVNARNNYDNLRQYKVMSLKDLKSNGIEDPRPLRIEHYLASSSKNAAKYPKKLAQGGSTGATKPTSEKSMAVGRLLMSMNQLESGVRGGKQKLQRILGKEIYFKSPDGKKWFTDAKALGRMSIKKLDSLTAQINAAAPKKLAKGGATDDEEVDLFEQYDLLPENIQALIGEYQSRIDDEDPYELAAEYQKRFEAEGYTFDWGLDGEAINLRKFTVVTPTELAKEFSRLIREKLKPTDMGRVIALNKSGDYTTACPTHEFCDANQVMMDAFENLAGRPYSFDDDSTDHEVTEQAWSIAREHDFYHNEKLSKGGSTDDNAPTSVIPYDEDQHSSVMDYLEAAITDVFGKQNIYSGSADWGGIPVWTVNGGMYEGTFIVIDDNENVILMTRKFDEENEQNIDTDIEQVNAPSPSELDSDPTTVQKNLLHLFKTAWSMKKSGKKLAKGGSVSIDTKIQKQIDQLEASIASPATPDNMKDAMRAKVAELKASAKPAKSKPVSKTEILRFINSSKTGVTAEAIEGQFPTLSPAELSTALSELEKAGKAHVNAAGRITGGPTPKKADKNVLNDLKPKFNKQIDDYGITSAIMVDGELNTVSDYEIPADTATAMENHLKGQKGPEKGQKKSEPAKKAEPAHSGKTGSDLVKYVDKEIDGIIGKTLYFKAGANGKWIKGKIEAIEPFDKTKEHWNIEFYPVGGAKEFDAPMVSDKLTTKQLDEFIHGGELKKYTLTKPESEVIKDFDDAIKEIDICHEEAKSKRVSNQRKNPPVKKKPAEILKNKVSSLHGYALKRIEKKNPEKAPALKKILDRHKKELESFFAGKK